MNTKNILIPLDDSEKTFDSLNYVKDFFPSEDITVHVLHIANNYDVRNTDPSNPDSAINLSKDILSKAESLLEGYKVNPVAEMGSQSSVVTDILSFIDDENIDYIVMTKTGKGFFDKYIIGSITRHILSRSPVPIMLIP